MLGLNVRSIVISALLVGVIGLAVTVRVPGASPLRANLRAFIGADHTAAEALAALHAVRPLARSLWRSGPDLRVQHAKPKAKARTSAASYPGFGWSADTEAWALRAGDPPRDTERTAASGETASAVPVTALAQTVPVMPVAGRVTDGFGYRTHPILGGQRMHKGMDIGAALGAPVVAALGGTVAVAGPAGTLGIAVYIDHSGGRATRYAHLADVTVQVGQVVTAGQTIGHVGDTGESTGPHLHFELRVDGQPVDPESLFAASTGKV